MVVRRRIVVEIVLVLFAASIIAVAALGQQNRDAISNVRTASGAVVRKQVQVGTVAGEKTVVRGDIGLRKIATTAKETELRANEYIVARWADKEVKIPPIATRSGNAWSVGFRLYRHSTRWPGDTLQAGNRISRRTCVARRGQVSRANFCGSS
jgi:hypothetical protein